MRRRNRRFGLRARATAGFGVIGLGVAISMGLVTWLAARSYLVDQREAAAIRQTFADARLTRSALRAPSVDVAELLTGLGGESGSAAVVRHGADWFAGSLSLGRDALPADLRRLVEEGGTGRQRFTGSDGMLHLAVGVALPAVDASYFEVFSLAELERTLTVLRNSLVAGVVITSVVAAASGRVLAGRVLRPLSPMTTTAQRIAAGDLAARLATDDDPDLAPLTAAFNTMTDALEQRIAADARFAADVSHELRSPLAVLSTSVEVINRRRDQLSDVAAEAFDLLTRQVSSFEALVLDLLEISRYDSRVATLDIEPIRLEPFLRQLLKNDAPDASLTIDSDVPGTVMADRRRLAQALHNLCHNAASYAGGTTAVRVSTAEAECVSLDFDDQGPGVPARERPAIFERFARGAAGRRHGTSSGTGLGLALVVEHVKLHGGSVEVLDAPGGGARFRVTIPAEQ